MKKWTAIQALRGIAVLGVVAFHSLSVEKKYFGENLLLPHFFTFGQSGVDLFFVISGFIMVTVTAGRFGFTREVKKFAWSRLARIYPTYWFYLLLSIGIFLAEPSWVFRSLKGDLLISSFFLLPSDELPLVMVAWSLVYELWFYAVFAILLRFKEAFLLPSLIVWGCVVASVNIVMSIHDLPSYLYILFHPYSLEFIGGALSAILLANLRPMKLSRHIAILTIALILFVGLPLAYANHLLMAAPLMRVGAIGTLYIGIVLCFVLLESCNTFVFPNTLQFVGDISYTVYLSHALVLNAVALFCSKMSSALHDGHNNMLIVMMMFAAVIGYGWVGYRFIERPLLRYSHILSTRWFSHAS